MREYAADADGIVLDSVYAARVAQWDPSRWSVFQPWVDKILAFVGRGARVLDLGAGEGFFTKCCVENGLDTTGLEGSRIAVEWGRRALQIDAKVHNLRDPLPFSDKTFDFVMYHDVYEHVPDRVNRVVCSEAFRVLRPSGFFWVITTCKYDLVECAEPEHINNPTPTELARYGRQFGFTARIMRPAFNISLFTPYFHDRDFNPVLWKRKLRDFLEIHHRAVTLAFAPVWVPIWYVNSRVLHCPLLDFVGRTSNVLFRK